MIENHLWLCFLSNLDRLYVCLPEHSSDIVKTCPLWMPPPDVRTWPTNCVIWNTFETCCCCSSNNFEKCNILMNFEFIKQTKKVLNLFFAWNYIFGNKKKQCKFLSICWIWWIWTYFFIIPRLMNIDENKNLRIWESNSWIQSIFYC